MLPLCYATPNQSLLCSPLQIKIREYSLNLIRGIFYSLECVSFRLIEVFSRLPAKAATKSISDDFDVFNKIFVEKNFHVAQVNQWCSLEESGQWLENLVLASGKLALQKRELIVTVASSIPTHSYSLLHFFFLKFSLSPSAQKILPRLKSYSFLLHEF